ncbi:hypothetical protein [Rubrivirga sp. IMCC45206]|uniref:hypothetical protein n=1 Tax=Rubrivirga sp. IMCC45206 TaxID=3391614 RepID=UPI00398FF019
MRPLLILPLLALGLLACSDNADSADGGARGEGATARPTPLERTPEGGVVDQRAEAVTVRSLDAGDRWCVITYETSDGEMGTANGYSGLCEQTDKLGQEVQLGLTTFDAPVACADGSEDCVDGRIEVVNVFLPLDAQ